MRIREIDNIPTFRANQTTPIINQIFNKQIIQIFEFIMVNFSMLFMREYNISKYFNIYAMNRILKKSNKKFIIIKLLN